MPIRNALLLASAAIIATVSFSTLANAADLAAVETAPDAVSDATSLGPWKVRLRSVYVLTDNKGQVNGVTNSDLAYSNTVIPELDISYYFSDNIAAELILGTTSAKVQGKGSIAGLGEIGSVWLLPPTLTLQYHFTNFGDFKPYVGAGISYTMFYNQDAGSADSLHVKNTFGTALQAGLDYQIDEHWDFNVDVKKIFLQPKFDVTVNGVELSGRAKINPWLIGTGFGYRF